MKTLISINILSLLFASNFASAQAPLSSMQPFYDEGAKMCRPKPAQTASEPKFNAAAWILSLAPVKKKEQLASCCAAKPNHSQASAE